MDTRRHDQVSRRFAADPRPEPDQGDEPEHEHDIGEPVGLLRFIYFVAVGYVVLFAVATVVIGLQVWLAIR